MFERLFEEIVRQGAEVGVVQGQHLPVDSSYSEGRLPPADACALYSDDAEYFPPTAISGNDSRISLAVRFC